ncbi:MAG: hypothetical protein QXD44_01640 [Candidatus Nezhaarchaeales archaeon]
MPPLNPDDIPRREPIVVSVRRGRTGYAVSFEEEKVVFPKYDADNFIREVISAIMWETSPGEVQVEGHKDLAQQVLRALRPTWWL